MGKKLKGMSSRVRTTFLYGSGGGGGGLQRIWSYWRGGTHNNFALTVTVCTSRRIESSVIIGRV